MKKMYIAVLDEVPDYMVPTLVAHTILNAHTYFLGFHPESSEFEIYCDWWENSYRKVVLKVNRKEYEKIKQIGHYWEGHENTTLGGRSSCIIPLPVESDSVPNVLKFAKMWKPSTESK